MSPLQPLSIRSSAGDTHGWFICSPKIGSYHVADVEELETVMRLPFGDKVGRYSQKGPGKVFAP